MWWNKGKDRSISVQEILVFLCGVSLIGCSSDFKVKDLQNAYDDCLQKACRNILVEKENPIELDQIIDCSACLSDVERAGKALQTQVLDIADKSLLSSLLNEVEQKKRFVDTLRHDPAQYNLRDIAWYKLHHTSEPISYRLDDINWFLMKVPDYYEAAKANIVQPIPDKCRLAVQKQLLSLDFLNHELKDSLFNAPVKKQFVEQMLVRIDHAKLAIKDYIGYCESLWLIHQDTTLH